MNSTKKWDILFIKDTKSLLDSNTKMLTQLFNKVDVVSDKEAALKLFESQVYDMVVSDITVQPEKVALLKQMRDIKPQQEVFALLLPKDTGKLYGIADLGINAFELEPEQFDQALETIAQFDPYEKHLN